MIKEINGRFTCTKCRYEWSSMLGDDEVPSRCSCEASKVKIAEFFRDIGKSHEGNHSFYFTCNLDEGTCEILPVVNSYVKFEIVEVHPELKKRITQIAKLKSLRVDWINTTKLKLSEN